MSSYGKVPAYTDISHFRAPYKNAYIAGFGGTPMQGYGNYGYGAAVAPPPAPPPPPEAPGVPSAAMFVETDDRGYRFVKKSLKATLMQTLGVYGTTFLGGPYNNVKITPYTNEQMAAAKADPEAAAFLDAMSAATWVKKQEDEGNVVFMSMATLVAVMTGTALLPGADTLGTFPAGSEQAKEAAKSPLGVVVAGDPDGAAIAGLGAMAIALVAVAAVGGVYLIARSRKGRGARLTRAAM